MLDKTFKPREKCIECDKEIQPEEKVVLMYKDGADECWIHAEPCLATYKKLLDSPEAKKQGIIIGLCDSCHKPIREKQDYTVGRNPTKKEYFNRREAVYGESHGCNLFNTAFATHLLNKFKEGFVNALRSRVSDVFLSMNNIIMPAMASAA